MYQINKMYLYKCQKDANQAEQHILSLLRMNELLYQYQDPIAAQFCHLMMLLLSHHQEKTWRNYNSMFKSKGYIVYNYLFYSLRRINISKCYTYLAQRTQFVWPVKDRTNRWDCWPLRAMVHNFAVLSSDAVRTWIIIVTTLL